MSMKEIASWALNVCGARGAQFADCRIVDERQRGLATKNGKVGHVADSQSLGIGIRVLADGAWGFAATEDLTRDRRRDHRRAGGRDCARVGPGQAARRAPRARDGLHG